MLKRIFILFAMVSIAGCYLNAQVTTSSISGNVKDATSGDPLIGATIIATHQPTGTRYTTITRGGGEYAISNMRVGGPYLVQISFVGYDLEKIDELFLKLAENFIINSTLGKTIGTLENVIVSTGRRNPIMNSSRTGAVTNISSRQIRQSPSISRSINDLTRATPQSNNNAFGGGNYRQSNFTVDGGEFNNSFGIGTSNLPAGGSPISLDALDEISVNITPFDVRQSGFIGSAINAVTKSGTNKFSGSVYSYFRNEKQRGNNVGGVTFVNPIEEFNQKGATLGGPIIKNKLFFFVSFETESIPRTIQTRVASTPSAPFGSANNIARPTEDSLNYISKYLKDNYNYETGPFQNYTPNIDREKLLARIDWNINSKHRLNVRYSQVKGGTPLSMSGSLNSAGTVAGIVTSNARTSVNSMWYEKSNYFQGENFYSFSAELNSNLGKVTNTLRATYTFQDENRTTESAVFPFVDILSNTSVTPVPPGLGAPYVSFGHEPFSFGNLRSVKVYSVIDNFSWVVNKHKWTAGVQYEKSQTINGFQPFGTSYYRFASWGDFASALDPNPLNRKLPTDFVQTFSLSKDFAPAFSSFEYAQYSVYGQDEISVNKDFRLTLGLRLELPTYQKIPQINTNPLLAALTFEDGVKLDQGVLPKNTIMWSPRIGFNWDIYGDRSLQIRGGTGIFTGRIPYVWAVAQSSSNNMIQVTQAFNTYSATGVLTGILPPGPFNPSPTAYRPSVVPAAGTSVSSTPTQIAPDFKNPQSWKTSVAVDKKMPWGIIGSIEAIFNKDIVTIFPVNPNFNKPLPLSTMGYPDNRLIYGGTNQTRFINTLNSSFVPVANGSGPLNPTLLENSKKGYYFSLTIKFDKTFNKGLYASLAYTKTIAGNLHDGGGDQPSGVWSGTPTVNGANTTPLGYADYTVPDRVIGVLSYRKEYFKHLATTVSFIYNGSIAGRFSYLYSGDLNRDGVSSNDLIYIPKDARNPSEISFGTSNVTVNGVSFTPAQQAQIFENYIAQDKYLNAHRGQYAERNGAQLPWLNRLDVKFMQDLFVNIGKNRNTIQFTADILNFGNLIDNNWGKLRTINGASILTATLPPGFGPGGTVPPTFRMALANNQIITKTFRDRVDNASTYSIQFGLRYIFN